MREDFHDCVWPSKIPELFREPRRHERRDAAEHRQRILEVARHLFAQQGVEAVSMHQIALAAGIGQGTLYRRYTNKNELCMDLLREQHERFGEEIAALVAQSPNAPALERLKSVLAKMIQFLEEQYIMEGLATGTEKQDIPCNESDLSRHIAMQQTPLYRWLHELLLGFLTEAIKRSELDNLDAPYTADAILAALHPTVYRFQRQERGFSSERILQGLHHIYIDGIKAPSVPTGKEDEYPTV